MYEINGNIEIGFSLYCNNEFTGVYTSYESAEKEGLKNSN